MSSNRKWLRSRGAQRVWMTVNKWVRSYGGQRVRTTVFEPASHGELLWILAYARANDLSVTFRGSGHAFDTQSLNAQLVIAVRSLPGMTTIQVASDLRSVTVGGAATWGDILRVTAAHGRVPYVMPTGSKISAGGSVSSNTVSRFSPQFEREGAHVLQLRLLTVDGNTHVCSPQQNEKLFRGVVGGLGYLGLVREITYELYDTGISSGREVAVWSEFVPMTGVRDLAETLTACVQQQGVLPGEPPNSCFRRAGLPLPPYAVTAALYMNKERQGIITRSHYKRCPPERLRRSIEHNPRGFWHLLVQLLALTNLGRRLGWWYILNLRFGERRTAIDELHGYTFFEDGNQRARKLVGLLGFSAPLRQQTYLLPWDAANPKTSGAQLAKFLEDTDRLLDSDRLLPSIIDVLYLGNGTRDAFYLSSSYQTSAIAVSIAFQKLCGSMAREESALERITTICAALGGRVHLVKNVYADPKILESMYPALTQMKTLKQVYDPRKRLRNEFLRRVFPGLYRLQ